MGGIFKFQKQGFTLVELLAVIVILAIILAIAVPSITSLIENEKI
jgi:type IV pilus assembly protein PilA